MPQSLSKVYTHIIFSTKHRNNLIDDTIENDLYNYIGGICKDSTFGVGCKTLQFYGITGQHGVPVIETAK
jgi:hypothetical protein